MRLRKDDPMDDRAGGYSTAFTPETLADYISSGVPSEQRVGDAPPCILGIDPARGQLTLRTPATGPGIDVSAYRIIRADVIEDPGEETVWFRLTVDADEIEYEAYSLLQSVADQLQQGDDMEHALRIAMESYHDLLARAPRLSADQEIGLFGELIALERAIENLGETVALAAWLGPQSEEHDFALPEGDLEVKTTMSERRIHVIHGIGQLTPKPGRSLRLMSIQVTCAGSSVEGRTLPEVIGALRGGLQRGRAAFDERLGSLGWSDCRAEILYTTRFLLRSEPAFYAVDESFPAITADGLAQILARPDLVRLVDYRIDVTALEPCPPLGSLVDDSGNDEKER